MKQTEQFIKSRDKVRNYFNFSKMLGNTCLGIKFGGGLYNGVRNGDLNDNDIERTGQFIDEMKATYKESGIALKEFEKEFKRAKR